MDGTRCTAGRLTCTPAAAAASAAAVGFAVPSQLVREGEAPPHSGHRSHEVRCQ